MRSCGIRNVVPTMSMATGTGGPDGPTGDGGGITISEARVSGESGSDAPQSTTATWPGPIVGVAGRAPGGVGGADESRPARRSEADGAAGLTGR